MAATLPEWAERRPADVAVISGRGLRTFAELDANASRLARALRRRGLRAGDAVALMCENRPEFAEVVYACQRSGLRLTPVNWHLTGGEAGYILGNCGARAVFADLSRAEVAREAMLIAPGSSAAVVIGGSAAGFESYDQLLGDETGDPLEDASPGSVMLYTSGTTGLPKGVHRAAPAGAPTVNLGGYAEAGGDCHLCTGPLYHAAPLAFSLTIPLAFGATVVLMDAWDAEAALGLIQEHLVTHTHMVPTMFHRLLALPEPTRLKYDLSSLRYVLHGAAPCPVPVKRRMIDWLGPVIWEYYAATEGVGTFADSATWLQRPGTVGLPFAPGLVIVGDPDGRPLPAGQTGLVYLRAEGPARFSYFGDDAKTASAFRGDYFTLGDVGHMDHDGYLYLTDRSSDLIISGGVNIYPAEVDAVLLEHPDVADAATIGVPDQEWGEAVLAVVELHPGAQQSEELAEDLIQFCRQRLAHYKCPRRVDFTVSLPRQDSGKIYKRLLREQYRQPGS
jgi:long-chain acyl-CoA synthetase